MAHKNDWNMLELEAFSAQTASLYHTRQWVEIWSVFKKKKKEKKDGWVIVSIIPTDGAVFSPLRDPHLSQTQINVRSPSISPSFHLPRLLLRSNPPDANLSVYLSVWPPVAGMCRGLYFLHLADCRLCGAAALYAYEIGLLWLGMWFKGPYQVIRVFFFF